MCCGEKQLAWGKLQNLNTSYNRSTATTTVGYNKKIVLSKDFISMVKALSPSQELKLTGKEMDTYALSRKIKSQLVTILK